MDAHMITVGDITSTPAARLIPSGACVSALVRTRLMMSGSVPAFVSLPVIHHHQYERRMQGDKRAVSSVLSPLDFFFSHAVICRFSWR